MYKGGRSFTSRVVMRSSMMPLTLVAAAIGARPCDAHCPLHEDQQAFSADEQAVADVSTIDDQQIATVHTDLDAASAVMHLSGPSALNLRPGPVLPTGRVVLSAP
jgi:hypothetical protein